jgi:hypothetical protein
MAHTYTLYITPGAAPFNGPRAPGAQFTGLTHKQARAMTYKEPHDVLHLSPSPRTEAHGVTVPSINANGVISWEPRTIARHLSEIDYMIAIADAYVTGNGDPVAQSVDVASKEVGIWLTAATRENVIAYLSEA